MDTSINSMVGQSLVMQQAQAAQDVQMQVLRDSLDQQQQQVNELMASADTQAPLNPDSPVGSLVDTFA
ncbi:MAG: putative motility protein [Pseudomonadota bacterium]